jgi:hypothetical protein
MGAHEQLFTRSRNLTLAPFDEAWAPFYTFQAKEQKTLPMGAHGQLSTRFKQKNKKPCPWAPMGSFLHVSPKLYGFLDKALGNSGKVAQGRPRALPIQFDRQKYYTDELPVKMPEIPRTYNEIVTKYTRWDRFRFIAHGCVQSTYLLSSYSLFHRIRTLL